MGPRNGQLLQSFDEIGGIVVQRNGFRTRHRPFAGDGRPLWNEPAGSCSAETTTQTPDFWNNFGSLLSAVFAESQIPLINKIITVVFVINRRRLYHERAVAIAFRTVYHPSIFVFRCRRCVCCYLRFFFFFELSDVVWTPKAFPYRTVVVGLLKCRCLYNGQREREE